MVSLQLESLCLLVLDEDIRLQLRKLSRKLSFAYQELYDRLLLEGGDVGKFIINRLSAWMLYSGSSLYAPLPTLDSVLYAIAYGTNEHPNTGKVLELCRGFLVFDESSIQFHFAHPSVQDFLKKCLPQFSKPTSSGRTMLTQLYLDILNDFATKPELRPMWEMHRGHTLCLKQAYRYDLI